MNSVTRAEIVTYDAIVPVETIRAAVEGADGEGLW